MNIKTLQCLLIAIPIAVAGALSGCGGGGSSDTGVPVTIRPEPEPTPSPSETISWSDLIEGATIEPGTHMVSGVPEEASDQFENGTYDLDAGESIEIGDLNLTCAEGGEACTFVVMDTTVMSSGGNIMTSSPDSDFPTQSEPINDPVLEPRSGNLPYPLEAWNGSWYDASRNITWYPAAFGTQHYGSSHVPDQSARVARNMPIYHDSGHFGGLGLEAPERRLFVGIDQGTGHDLGNLSVVQHHGEFDVRYGRESDGAGHNAIATYLRSGQAVRQYDQPPTLRVVGPRVSSEDVDRAIRAVQVVNAALPVENRIHVSSSTSAHGFADAVSGAGTYSPTGVEERNTIYLEIVSRQDFYGTYPAVGTTWSFEVDGGTASYIQVVDSAGTAGETEGDEVDRRVTMLMAHEIIHALGIDGHVSPSLDSIMTEENTDAVILDGTDQPLSILYPADREALRAMYAGADSDSFGPWSDTSTHLHGNGPHAGFGVVLRNGYAEPWAYGYLPPFNLQDNHALSGTALWTGRLLGFDRNGSVVAGDAEIRVAMEALRGSAAFTSLESWSVGSAPGAISSGAIWGDGDLRYSIAVNGNTFTQIGGDDGTLTGIFTGESHEGAAGTLERHDLTAAFGATR